MSNAASLEVQAVFPYVTKYYYANGQRACPEPVLSRVEGRSRRVAMRQEGVVYYIHTDHLGSTSLTTDQNQQVEARQVYYPYGTPRWSQGTLPTDYTFTGQRDEAGLGLMHYGARFYSARLGRFVSADTIVPEPGEPQALNRFAYVRNNPVLYRDPSGHAECVDAECNQVVHPVTGEIIQRRSAPSPLEPGIPVPEWREKLEKGFGIGATVFDTMALAISVGGMIAEGAGLLASAVTGEPAPVLTAIGAYYGIMNPVENRVSTLGLVCAAAADLAGGKTYLDERNRELVIGQDTIVSSSALLLGNQPVVNLEGVGDTILNFGLVGYDVGRLGHEIPSVVESRSGFDSDKGKFYMDLAVYGGLAERLDVAPGDRFQITPVMGWVK